MSEKGGATAPQATVQLDVGGLCLILNEATDKFVEDVKVAQKAYGEALDKINGMTENIDEDVIAALAAVSVKRMETALGDL